MSHDVQSHNKPIFISKYDADDAGQPLPCPRLRIAMNIDDYEIVDRMSRNGEGLPLSELSEADAQRAYKITKMALYRFASRRMNDLELNDVQIACKDDATDEELAAIGRTLVDHIMPDEDTTVFDVQVGTPPSDLDVELLGANPRGFIPIAEMHVTPPDFAS